MFSSHTYGRGCECYMYEQHQCINNVYENIPLYVLFAIEWVNNLVFTCACIIMRSCNNAPLCVHAHMNHSAFIQKCTFLRTGT